MIYGSSSVEVKGGRWPLASRGDEMRNGEDVLDTLDDSLRSLGEDEVDEDEDEEDDLDDNDTANELFDRTADCLSDCFLEFCFFNRRFDASAFYDLSMMFFEESGITAMLEKGQRDLLKARVISKVLRRVFTVLALSKKQKTRSTVFLRGPTFCRRRRCDIAGHSRWLPLVQARE